MDKIKIDKIMENNHIIDITYNGVKRRALLEDIVDYNVWKNGHQFAVGIYRDYDYPVYYEVDVLMYNDEIFDMYTLSIKESNNY